MLALLACAVTLPSQAALAVSQPSLISAVAAYQPGKPFLVGIRFTMKPPWHVYWRNPGDSGQEVRVKWTLPPGWKASPIHWPIPESHTDDGATTFVYSREVVLPVEITPSKSAKPANIVADVSWLVCGDSCIPGDKRLSLSLAASGTPKLDSGSSEKLKEAMAKTPAAKGTGTAKKEGRQITLYLNRRPGQDTVFLPYDPGVLDHSKKQAVAADGALVLPVSVYFNAQETKRLRGIVFQYSRPTQRPIEIDVPLQIVGG